MATSAEIMARIHELTSEMLLQDLSSTDPEIRQRAVTAAIKFLKDNGIESAAGTNPQVNKIAQALPFSDEDEDNVIPMRR